MPSYDEDRRELFGLLEPSLGSRGAALLMEHLPPTGWADLATKSDLAGVRAEIATLRAELIEKMSESQRTIQTTMIQTMFGAVIAVSGLVFAVASFAR